MKPAELKGKSDDELALTLRDTEKHLFQLRFQSATDRLETPSEIKKAKKDIARIKTAQRQRELAKLDKATDEQIAAMIADAEAKTILPGKRRAKRTVARLTGIHEARQAKAAKTAAAAKKVVK